MLSPGSLLRHLVFPWVHEGWREVPGWVTGLGADGRQTAEDPQVLGPFYPLTGAAETQALQRGAHEARSALREEPRALKGPRCHLEGECWVADQFGRKAGEKGQLS